MKETYGDLWTHPADLRVITTNGIINSRGKNVMGRGCAAEAAARFPWLPARLGIWIRDGGNHVHLVYQNARSYGLASFPVKDHWRDPARLDLIERSARELVALADREGYQRIVLPRPGCGGKTGRLDWNDVKGLLWDILDDRFTAITQPPRTHGRPI